MDRFKKYRARRLANRAALNASIARGIAHSEKGLGRPHHEVMADIRDRIKVMERRAEEGMEANAFFNKIDKKVR